MDAVEAEDGLVDLVYLWVDGSDARWQQRREKDFSAWIVKHPDELAIYGNVAGRFRDNGELRFNFRCVDTFLTGVGNIFVIADDQRPPWLANHPKVTVVTHEELVGVGRESGIYDSGNLETYVHGIPSLRERFVYLNDDVFFGAPLHLPSLFDGPLAVYVESHVTQPIDVLQRWAQAPVNAAAISKRWLESNVCGYKHVRATFSHAPRPMFRWVMEQLEQEAFELFASARSTTFRRWDLPSLITDLVPRWMVSKGIADLHVFDSLYISTGSDEAGAQFEQLTQQFGSIPFFCLNDSCDDATDDDPRLVRVRRILSELLPVRSQFER